MGMGILDFNILSIILKALFYINPVILQTILTLTLPKKNFTIELDYDLNLFLNIF